VQQPLLSAVSKANIS